MSPTGIIIRYFSVALLVSVQTAILGIMYEGNADTASVINVLSYIFFLSALYFPFVLVCSFLIGIPALLFFRKMGWTNGPFVLGGLGAIVGTFACLLVLKLSGASITNVFSIGILLGGTGGGTAGILWWLLVERTELKENYD